MKQFNKTHVVKTLVENEGVSKNKAEEMVDSVLGAVIETLASAKDEEPNKKGIRAKLIMVGFGTLNLFAVKERKHRNPRTQVESVKPAHNDVRFSEGKLFAESVN